MKKLIIFLIAFLPVMTGFAQAPQSFSYQAVARDLSGNVLANKMVSFRVSMLSGSATGTVVFSESHTASTNEYGLVELSIGKGTVITGNFSTVGWGSAALYLKIEMDPAGGTAYQNLGTSQILSVPYALHAKSVETGDQWGSQSVVVNATLSGNGTTATPLKVADGGITSQQITDGTITAPDLANLSVTTEKIATSAVTAAKLNQSGATTGQVLKWGDKSWVPSDDLTGSAGPAGGDLTGTYPNPEIGTGKVTSTKILDGTVGTADLSNYAVTGAKIAQMGATDGQMLRYYGKAATWGPAFPLITTTMIDTLAVTGEKIADNSVGSIKIQSSAVTSAKLASEAVTTSKISRSGAVAGDVIKYNGTSWVYDPEIWRLNTTDNTKAYVLKNAGIGTDVPEYNLDVLSTTSYAVARIRSSYSNAGLLLQRNSASNFAYVGFNTTGTNQVYWMGLLGNNNFSISTTNTVLNGLEVKPEGDVNISNNLIVSGETHRPNTGDLNLLPWAMGKVLKDGTKVFGTPNFNGITSHLEGKGNYYVSLTNAGNPQDYMVIITPNAGDWNYKSFTVCDMSNSGFWVYFYDPVYDDDSDTGFAFLVYKP